MSDPLAAFHALGGPAPDQARIDRVVGRSRGGTQRNPEYRTIDKATRPITAKQRKEGQQIDALRKEIEAERSVRGRVSRTAQSVGNAFNSIPTPAQVMSASPGQSRWVTALVGGLIMLVVASQLSGNYFKFAFGGPAGQTASAGGH